MFTRPQFVRLSLALIALVPLCNSQSLNIQDDLEAGIAAYQRANYDAAISHLTRAVSLDPKQIQAHFYLAMSYNEKYVPDVETENGYEKRYWKSLTMHEYRQVLALDPAHKGALLRMAYIFYRESEYDNSEQYYRKALEIDQDDPEATYLLGVINFNRAYRTRVEEQSDLKLPAKTALIESAGCYSVRSKNIANVQEGIEMLERALEFTKNGKYDVQVYLSLLYRERAVIQCEDRPAYAADLEAAQKWHLEAKETLKHEERKSVPLRWPPAPPSAPENLAPTK